MRLELLERLWKHHCQLNIRGRGHTSLGFFPIEVYLSIIPIRLLFLLGSPRLCLEVRWLDIPLVLDCMSQVSSAPHSFPLFDITMHWSFLPQVVALKWVQTQLLFPFLLIQLWSFLPKAGSSVTVRSIWFILNLGIWRLGLQKVAITWIVILDSRWW